MAAVLSILICLVCIISVFGCKKTNNCRNKLCELVNATPKCTQGCTDGMMGKYCKELCQERCLACEQYNPENCTMCEVGRYGNTCEKQCDMCIDKQCYHNGTCVKGLKTVTREPGTVCPVGCKNDSCTNTNECKDGCLQGWTGPACEVNCTLFCTECQKIKQNTTDCSICDSDCPENCLQCNECGECSQCRKGWYGSICSKSCSGCKDKQCTDAGQCVDGCADGYTGNTCDDPSTDTDILSRILDQVKKNDLILPLVCSLVVFATFTGILIWRCKKTRREKSPPQEDNRCSFMRREKVEYPEIAKCGDIYHEIDDKDLDTVVCQTQEMLSQRPRLSPPLPRTQNIERPMLPIPQNTISTHSQQECTAARKDYMTPVDDIIRVDLHILTEKSSCAP